MDKQSIVNLLNHYLKTVSYDDAYTILYVYLKDKPIELLEEKIKRLMDEPLIIRDCLKYAVDKLCEQYSIITLSKDNQIILFY